MTTRRLPLQPWMTNAHTEAVIAALRADGAEVRFVGGCVRDTVLGRAIKDIDLATPDPPETVMALLARAGLKAVPTGIAHGTVTAVAEKQPFEVTTLRRDVETYGRHAKVEFTDDWREDAARRDLTFNAMSLSPDGTLHDYFGGFDDLRAGHVRFVGDALTRIEEDVLRLLRFFRFYAHYGKPPPDATALEACRRMAPKLSDLSGERIQAETMKLLAAPDPAPVVALTQNQQVLEHWLPEAHSVAQLAALVKIENGLGHEPDAILRLAALIDGGPEIARGLAWRLRLSNADRDRLVAARETRMQEGGTLSPALDARARRVALYRLGWETYRDRVLLGWAAAGVEPDDARWCALFLVSETPPPSFPLQGRDLLSLGMKAGRHVGELLKEIEAWWIAGDFKADRKACLEEASRRLKFGR
ncbi:poly(A) polymerase/tRNA-nucleotidyltransferase [Hypericibacter adhaerens]|jgi:poly(A) polymerase|uniref:Poly(A) polymerase/tRNA-nucleotidyltransferase n=1 Tax=Hypericibacter adhaerens TaxID=2602016 RepID=A0A5J6MUD8_9PROT|nr:CCA tRNA nucleotidyltransferase [Hypericibacter adhaerens]QEX21009.1 poly(A) polymerase/tRNA-nucleotidyltransferase [Hypericibacter adhaerens]